MNPLHTKLSDTDFQDLFYAFTIPTAAGPFEILDTQPHYTNILYESVDPIVFCGPEQREQ